MATIIPAVTATDVQAPAQDAPTPIAEKTETPRMSDPLGDIRVVLNPQGATDAPVEPAKEPEKQEQPPEPEKKKDAPTAPPEAKEPVKEEKPVEDKPDIKASPKAREEFQKLEDRNKALLKELEEAKKAQEEARKIAKAASIRRDPEFVKKFIEPRKDRENQLAEMAKAAGVEEAVFRRALRSGDEDQLAEWREQLKPRERNLWDVHQREILNLDYEANRAEEQAESMWEELQKSRQEQFNQQREEIQRENMADAQAVFSDLTEKVPYLRENEELRGQVEEMIYAMAGKESEVKFSTRDILRNAALAPVQQHILMGQKTLIEKGEAEIKKLTDELTARDEKIKELEAFVEKRSGSVPRGESGNGKPPENGKMADALGDIRVRVPGMVYR